MAHNPLPQATLQHEEQRALRLCSEAVDRHGLDLSGLTVFTEAATGSYRFTPHLCLLAGAERVLALARDTRWGTAEDAARQARTLAAAWGIGHRLHATTEKTSADLADADILTNSGNVRPIDAQTVAALKPTCVIPLMWETWEHRPEELDLGSCRERNILVLGTDEEAFGFRRYLGMTHLRAMLAAGLEVQGNRVLVLSGQPLARAICAMLRANGADYRWSCPGVMAPADDPDAFLSPDDRTALLDYACRCDAVICDERRHLAPLAGPEQSHPRPLLPVNGLQEHNPGVVFINRSGDLDVEALRSAGVRVVPDRREQKGYPNMISSSLGPLPVIELTAAGLRVAQQAARARLAGKSVSQAAAHAMRTAPAMDFEGDLSWMP